MAKKKVKSIKEVLGSCVSPSWAEYASPMLIPKHYVRRFDDKKGTRFYYFVKDGELIIAAGVTSVFGKVSIEREQINAWKESHPNWRQLLNITADYGTKEHQQHGNIMFKKGVDMKLLEEMRKIVLDNGGNYNMPDKDMFSFLKFQEDYQLVPLLTEAILVWQDPISGEWLAMTIDLLAKLITTIKNKTTVQDGFYVRGDKKGEPKYKDVVTEEKVEKTVLIDFKSNFFDKERKSYFETNKFQLMAASLAVEQNFGLKVDSCYNYSPIAWRTTPNYTLFEHTITDADWKRFYANWNHAIAYDIHKPEGNMMVVNGYENSGDFKFLSYREYVEQNLLPKPVTV